MNKVQGVSLPRTGHNMLVIHLKQYFADHVDCPKYKDFLIPPLAKRRTRIKTADDHRTPRFHYCEHYYSCRSIPCVDADNKFQKSHDFDLDWPVDTSIPHLVQVRDSVSLLISWYEMRLKKNREIDSPDGWRAFVAKNIPYVEGFLRKWLPVAETNGLVIEYEDYLSIPDQWLEKVIHMFQGDLPINAKKIGRIVKDVRPNKIATDFRYFDSTPSNAFLKIES